MPTAAELQAAAAAAAQNQQTAEQAAMLNAAYRNNELPRLPYYGAGSGITQEQAADAAYEEAKRQAAFSQPRSDVRELSGEAARISAEYNASRNRVVTGGGVSYQGNVSYRNPYPEDSAAGIAWEVAATGGATDYEMNRIAEAEVIQAGGDPGFIQYATDVYVERPQFEREVLTTRTGQQFVNEEWHGVPIRLNLTKAEMAAGGGINEQNFGKYLRYDDTTHLLNRIESGKVAFGIDTGVHKERGDFGGPWLEGGTCGGWRSGGGRLVGSKMVASEGEISQRELPKPFISTSQARESNEYQPSGFLGLGGLIPYVSKERFKAYVVASKADPVGSTLRMQNAMLAPAASVLGGVASRLTFGVSELAFKPAPITVGTGSQERTITETFDLPTTRSSEFTNIPERSEMSGGNQTITDLGNWLKLNQNAIDRTNKSAVEDYNKKVDMFSKMQEQNPVVITTFGGAKEVITETGGKRVVTTTTGESGFKTYASEWDKFVEGSGRVFRHVTGLTLEKQKTYFETIKNAPGVLGEAKRGVFYFGTEIVNKPAELAPAAITGFGISKVVAGAPGFLARVGEGTGLTARAAQFIQTPGGTSLVKAGAAGVFGGAYTWGVTEGLSASPEKTKENIYRSGPTLAAMYGGAGGLNWVGETKFIRGGSTPTGATFSGVQIQNTYFGGGRTPSGGRYAGAFGPTESYVITGKPQPVNPRARPLELPDLRPKKSGFVDADIGGDWVKPAQLPDYATPMETRSQSAGGMYARPEAVRDMTWDRPLTEKFAKGYAPSDVTAKTMENFYAKATTVPEPELVGSVFDSKTGITKPIFKEVKTKTGAFSPTESYAPSDVTKTWQTDSPFVEDKLTFIEIHGKDTLPAHLSKTIPETEYGYLSEMAKEQWHHKLFAISEGKIVGGVSYGYMELGDTFGGERYLEMYSMEAVPRGSWVGTAIVDKIEQIARSKNVKAIEGASLRTAIGFWKKMGYEHPSENKFAMYDIRKPIMQEPEPYNPLNPKRVYAETQPKGKSIEQIKADAFFGTKEPFYEISDKGVMQPRTQTRREPEPYNPLNPKRVYAEPTPISDSTKRMFEDIHISGVPDRVVQMELANINRGFFENPASRGYETLVEREYPYTRIEREAVTRQRERERKIGFAEITLGGFGTSAFTGSSISERNANKQMQKISERRTTDITPWERQRTVPATKAPGITDITTPFSKQTERIVPYKTSEPRERFETEVTPQEQEFPWKRTTDNPPPPKIITPDPYKIPPIDPIGGWGLPGGGGGYGRSGNLGVITWRRNNLIADQPYLARGIAEKDFGFADDRQGFDFEGAFGSRKSKRRKNPFGF